MVLKRIISLVLSTVLMSAVVAPGKAFAPETGVLTLSNLNIGGNYVVGTRFTNVSLENVTIGGNIIFERGTSETVILNLSEDSSVGGVIFTRRAILANKGYIKQVRVDEPLEVLAQGAIDFALVNAKSNLVASLEKNAGVDEDGAPIIEKTPLLVMLCDGMIENATGFVTVFGDVYCGLEDGSLAKGFAEVDGKSYWFGGDGIMKTGLIDTAEGKYYLGTDGVMRTGPVEINGKMYNFGEDGLLRTGFVTIDGQRYYYNEFGYVAVDCWVDGAYRAGADGVLVNSKTGNADLDAAVDRILANITTAEMTDRDKMRAIYPWLTKNIGWRGVVVNLPPGEDEYLSFAYTEEEIVEMALYAYENRKGSCEHLAALGAVLIRRLGYDTRVIYGLRKGYAFAGAPWGEHAWIEVTMDGERYHFDPQYAATHMKDNFYYYFLLHEDASREHHKWSV